MHPNAHCILRRLRGYPDRHSDLLKNEDLPASFLSYRGGAHLGRARFVLAAAQDEAALSLIKIQSRSAARSLRIPAGRIPE